MLITTLIVVILHSVYGAMDPEDYPGIPVRGTFVDCRYLGPIRETPLVRPSPCLTKIDSDETIPVQMKMYLLKKEYAVVEGWECTKRYMWREIKGQVAGCYETGIKDENREITPEECRSFVEKGASKDHSIFSDNIISTFKEPCKPEYDCCYTGQRYAQETTGITAVRSSFRVSLDSENVDVPGALNTESCTVSSKGCRTGSGSAIWSVPRDFDNCRVEESDIYLSTMTHSPSRIELAAVEVGLLFIVSSSQTYKNSDKCSYGTIYVTDEGFLFQILNGTSYLTVDQLPDLKKTELIASSKAGPKMNAMFRHLQNETEWAVHQLHQEICEERHQIWNLAFMLRNLDPIRMPRILMGRDDIVGLVAGGVIRYQECQNLKDWRFKRNGRCGYLYKVISGFGGEGCVSPDDIYITKCPAECPLTEGDLNFVYNATHIMVITHSDVSLKTYTSPFSLPEPKFSKQETGNLEIYGARSYLFPKSMEQRIQLTENRLQRIYQYTVTGVVAHSDPEGGKWSLGKPSGMGFLWGWISSWGYAIYVIMIIFGLIVVILTLRKAYKTRICCPGLVERLKRRRQGNQPQTANRTNNDSPNQDSWIFHKEGRAEILTRVPGHRVNDYV